ncbi:hypothetical protein M407DRAFT_160388 [Tulasnella calospora MUT 4182]|uniref:Uncharacterized protein n=1 Tax=Tulasnella calospora MUT 4182 TaxID=1051891 RepID=A0A0C3LA54_9AGAM|nr:hypothetical protein M407DRAFT_160388 [Tulasnella calospora MUT 4182]
MAVKTTSLKNIDTKLKYSVERKVKGMNEWQENLTCDHHKHSQIRQWRALRLFQSSWRGVGFIVRVDSKSKQSAEIRVKERINKRKALPVNRNIPGGGGGLLCCRCEFRVGGWVGRTMCG